MIEQSADISELAKALHGAQGMVDGVRKDATNPHFRNRYASLEAVIDTARPALQANGLAFTQAPGALVDGAIEITTMLTHTSGQWLRSTLHVPVTKKDAQGVGSAITYGCRYSLMATLGLPPVDDDGEAASRPAPPSRHVEEPERPPERGSVTFSSGLPAGPAGNPVDLKEIVAYVSKARTDILGMDDPAEIRAWFGHESGRRAALGITKDSQSYQDLVDACHARIDALSEKATAEAVHVPRLTDRAARVVLAPSQTGARP